jgi:hypothetical protein
MPAARLNAAHRRTHISHGILSAISNDLASPWCIYCQSPSCSLEPRRSAWQGSQKFGSALISSRCSLSRVCSAFLCTIDVCAFCAGCKRRASFDPEPERWYLRKKFFMLICMDAQQLLYGVDESQRAGFSRESPMAVLGSTASSKPVVLETM